MIKNDINQLIEELTGFSVSELEPNKNLQMDLALDSIKMMGLMSQFVERFDHIRPLTVADMMEWEVIEDILVFYGESASLVSDEQDISITNDINQLIAELTGFSINELEPDKNLQMDLALDSIKMMGLMSQFVERFDHIRQLTVADMMEWEVIKDILVFYGEPTPLVSDKQVISREEENNVADSVFPILNSQQLFLLSHSLNSGNGLCTRLKLSGYINFDLAQQAWQLLVERTPALRTYFVLSEEAKSFSETVCYLKDSPKVPALGMIDLQSEQQAQELLDEGLNRHWALDKWPLHQFDFVRINEQESYLYFTNDHVIADGRGNQKIITGFMEIYAALIADDIVKLTQPVSDLEYAQAMSRINESTEDYQEQDYQNHMRELGKKPFFWNPKKSASDQNKSSYHNIFSQLSGELTAQLLTLTKQYGVSMNSLLIGSFVRALHTFGLEGHEVVLQLPTSGTLYPIDGIEQMVGCFAQNIPFMTKDDFSTENFSTQVQNLHQKFYLAISQGIDVAQSDLTAAVVRGTVTLDRGKIPTKMLPLIRSSIRSNLYFPYVGRIDLNNYYGNLQITEYRPATSNSSGAIDFLQEIHDEKLVISLNYDELLFDRLMMEHLMKTYQQSLLDLTTESIKNKEVSSVCTGYEPGSQISSPVQKTSSVVKETSERLSHSQLTDTQIADLVFMVTEQLNIQLSEEDVNLDFEADLGIDSLELIRLFNKIAKKYTHVKKQSLFYCRSIKQIFEFIIEKDSPHTDVEKVSKLASTSTQALKPKVENTDISSTLYHLGTDDIPLSHIIKQASKTPDATAVSDKKSQMTYQELDQTSNQLANYLIEQNIGRGRLVGIHIDRCCDMVVAMLAVLKTGAAYVPIDDSFPAQRVSYILNHAQCDILLTNATVAKQVDELLMNQHVIKTLVFMDQWTPLLANSIVANVSQVSKVSWSDHDVTSPNIKHDPEDTMVVLYTSGSTGDPKGVELNHLGYMVRMEWHQNLFQMQPGDRVAQKTSCSFDISVWEIYWPLMAGGQISIVDKNIVRNPWAFSEWLATESINYLHFVPSMLGEFLHSIEDDVPNLPALKYLVCSGEALPRSFVRHWFELFGERIPLANLYGPTEASIDVSAHVMSSMPANNDKAIPIGKAMPGVQLLIIDTNGQRVNGQGTGELCIAGPQLAKGYLNNEQKTASTFINNVWDDIAGDKVYKTGDLVSCDSNGSYIYRGRLDHQVKIRGYRVELGEIENVLSVHPCINEIAVVVREFNHSPKLVCFFVGEKTSLAEINNYAKNKLPSYMLPSFVVRLAALPKNHNGKLDRNALLDVDIDMSVPRGQASLFENRDNEQDNLLPLGPAQRWIIQHFDNPYSWFGFHRFTYKQALDVDAFTKSINQVIIEHDALRTVFEQKGDTYRQNIMSENLSVEPLLFSAEHLTAAELDEHVSLQIKQIVAAIEINTLPLWRMLVIKVSDKKYDISIVGHHLVSDMVASSIFFRSLWSHYNQFLNNKTALSANLSNSYGDYVKKLQQMDDQGELTSHINYWREHLSAVKIPSIIPPDYPQGANNQSSEEVISRSLSVDATAKLMSSVKEHFNAKVYSALASPLYDQLATTLELDSVVVSHKLNGRGIDINGINNSESLGNYAVNVPVALDWCVREDWRSKISKVEQAITDIPLGGITYDWIAERLPEHCYPDDKLTSVRLNFLGHIINPPSQLFEFSEQGSHQRLSLPQQKRVSEIEFWISIVDKELVIKAGYSTNRYRSTQIEKLVDGYLSSLLKLIFSTQENESKTELEYAREGV
jgi:fengycin family lipopeptide synthetase B